MIKLTKLNNEELYINIDLIEFVEAIPDTVISMTTGRKAIVRETLAETLQIIKICRGERVAELQSSARPERNNERSSTPLDIVFQGVEAVSPEAMYG